MEGYFSGNCMKAYIENLIFTGYRQTGMQLSCQDIYRGIDSCLAFPYANLIVRISAECQMPLRWILYR